jgi:hypothetical protein
MESIQRDQMQTTHLVIHYLLAQDWQLADDTQFAEAVVQAVGSEAPKSAVETQIWQQYAAILHDSCHQPNSESYQRAWYELDSWLRRQRQALPWQPQDQEEAIQETLAALQVQLEKKPLKAPRAFLVYALQTLRRTAIDGERKQTAVSRGGDQETLSWEALHEAGPDPLAAPMHAEVTQGSFERRVEHTVSEREVHAKLKAFFSQHLKSDQQCLVAELLFLDGLHPKEIADLMHKEPHQIRMVKSRIVQTLRSLPPDEQQALLALLDQADREEPDDA